MGYGGTSEKIQFGELGLVTDISSDKIPPGALINAKNVCLTNGNVQKAPGTLVWNALPLTAGIVAVHHWKPNSVVERYIAATSVGEIFKGQSHQFGTPINSSISSVLTPNCMFSEGGAETAGREKKLFFFTGGATNPYVLSGDGTAFTSLSSPNTDWTSAESYPRCGCIHRNSLWAFAGQISYASSTGNHEDFSSGSAAFINPVYPGEGGEIRGSFVFKSRLFCFKEGGFVYMLNDSSSTAAEWFWEKAGSNFGLAAPNAIAEVLNDMFAGNDNGTLNSYAATEKLGNVEAGDIIQQLQFESHLRANSSKVGVPYQHLHYYAEKKQLFMTYRSHYRTTNDMLIVFDFNRPNQIRPTYWIKGSPQCLAFYRDNNNIKRPMYGDADGYLHMMDYEDRIEGLLKVSVQTITASATLTTGSYTLSFAGQTTNSIAYNAPANTIEAELQALTGLSNVIVNGSFTTAAASINISFFGYWGVPPNLTFSANTTGQTFTTAVSSNNEGSAYTGDFQTPHYDFSWINPAFSAKEKHFDFLAVHYIPESSGNLSCDYFIDGRYYDTITFPMIQYTRPQLDTLELDTDRLAQANHETAIRKCPGSGRTISFRFYQAGSNESFQIPAITVMFRPGGEKAQQV